MSAGTLAGEHPETTTAAGDAPVLVHRADGVVTVDGVAVGAGMNLALACEARDSFLDRRQPVFHGR